MNKHLVSKRNFFIQAVFATALLLGMIILAISRGQISQASSSKPEDHLISNSALLIDTRTQLSLCVEETSTVRGQSDENNYAVQNALTVVSMHKDWQAAGLANRPTSIRKGGCQNVVTNALIQAAETESFSINNTQSEAEQTELVQGASVIGVDRNPSPRKVRQNPFTPQLTTSPSEYRSMVVILDDRQADRLIGKENVKLIPTELMAVSDHEAVEVTSALVVRKSYLSSPDFAKIYMTMAVGLDPGIEFPMPQGEISTK